MRCGKLLTLVRKQHWRLPCLIRQAYAPREFSSEWQQQYLHDRNLQKKVKLLSNVGRRKRTTCLIGCARHLIAHRVRDKSGLTLLALNFYVLSIQLLESLLLQVTEYLPRESTL